MNLLIVDDHPVNRKLLRAALESEGHEVTEAEDGLGALQVLERASMDAVISDILMPRMDGFRLCREVRRSASPMAGVAIVLYTSTYNSPSDRQLAAAVGADCYLMKPAPIVAILDAVRDAQEKARKRPAAARETVNEAYVLEQYSAVLVGKLEQRNAELQEALASLQSAHQQILELNQNLEARVAQRTAALDDANKELEAFSFSVSHDLRAPLRHIHGFADLLDKAMSPPLRADARELAGRILVATRQMNRLIDALLDFARTSRKELTLAEVDLERLLDEVIEGTRSETENRQIVWRRSRLPRVLGDATLLRQVLINLLSNAIKYSRTRTPAVIEIGTRAGRADEVVIFVRDNGVGFDLRSASELFGVFRRLHRADEFEGTGIGLANAHRIVTRHGGTIWADATIDRGATFYFSLPGTGLQ